MNVAELTAIILAITGLLSGVALPLYLNHRKSRQDESDQKTLTTSGVIQMIAKERDSLLVRIDKQAADHTQELADMRRTHAQELAAVEAKWQVQHEKDQTQIAGLRDEVDALYRRLYQPPPIVR
jgi:hypothetical protein